MTRVLGVSLMRLSTSTKYTQGSRPYSRRLATREYKGAAEAAPPSEPAKR